MEKRPLHAAPKELELRRCWVAWARGLSPKSCTRPSAAPRAVGCAESMQKIFEVPRLVRASKAASPIALPPPRALPDSRCVAEGWLRKRAADRPAAMHSWLLPQPVAFSPLLQNMTIRTTSNI